MGKNNFLPRVLLASLLLIEVSTAQNNQNDPITIPHKINHLPFWRVLGSAQDPDPVVVGHDVTVTWQIEASTGFHTDSYIEGDPVPTMEPMHEWGIKGYNGVINGDTHNFTLVKTFRASHGEDVHDWSLGQAWCKDPCDGTECLGIAPFHVFHILNTGPAPPNTSEPHETVDPIGGISGGGETPDSADDQGEVDLPNEVVDPQSYVQDPNRGSVPTRSDACAYIKKTDLSDPTMVGTNDVTLNVVHRIVTINSPEERDLKGTLKLELESGIATDYVIFRLNPETGVQEEIALPYELEVTEPGHSGDGVHDWHAGTESYIFRRTGDGPLNIKCSVDPDQGAVFKTATLHLLPVEVVPDYNRDGMINDEDRGKVTEETPFVFWINDDDDGNPEPHFGDIPGTQVDGADMLVNSARDLVDFFPVQLRIKEVLAALPADQYTYKILHPTGAFHFIEMPNVQPDSSPEAQGAGSYLRNPTMAEEAMSRPMMDTAGAGAELSAEYLAAAHNEMGVLLFEAKAATSESFELIISKKSGGGEVGRITRAMPWIMEDVEKLFWRSNIRAAVYGAPPGTVKEPENAKFKASRKARWFVFCHGYNVNEEAARGWNSEVFKRLHQMGSDSKFLGVTWEGNQGQISPSIPCAGGETPDYWQNVYNAFQSSEALAGIVNGLSGGAKVIAGHSLGNMLVSSAICDKNLVAEQYFMLNAAVPREAYSVSHTADRYLVRNPSWSEYDGDTRLWSSDYWDLFSDDDGRHNLTWRGRFSKLGANTAPYNYYSSGEEVLKKGNGNEPSILTMTITGERSWVKQEMGKGGLLKKWVSGVKSSDGGWAYNPAWNGNPPAADEPLKGTPFFKPFSQFTDGNGQNLKSIHGPDGSNLASQYAIRAFLLAHDVPAVSNPAGSDIVDFGGQIESKNRNMMAMQAENWGDWKHCDIKKRPIEDVWKVYSDMVSRGSLNKGLIPPPIN